MSNFIKLGNNRINLNYIVYYDESHFMVLGDERPWSLKEGEYRKLDDSLDVLYCEGGEK